MKLISFSVYGTKPMYLEGLRQNLLLAPGVYPGWKVRVYHSGEVPKEFWNGLDCEHIGMGHSLGSSGMFWRFLPAFEKKWSHVIFRDADSRLNIREAAAVLEWLKSGKKIHCMHDHEHHRCLPIFGGMWGIRTGVLSNTVQRKLLRFIKREQQRGDDMLFLEKYVFPEVCHSIMRHSSVRVKWPEAIPFPAHPPYEHFVGRQFNEQNGVIL